MLSSKLILKYANKYYIIHNSTHEHLINNIDFFCSLKYYCATVAFFVARFKCLAGVHVNWEHEEDLTPFRPRTIFSLHLALTSNFSNALKNKIFYCNGAIFSRTHRGILVTNENSRRYP